LPQAKSWNGTDSFRTVQSKIKGLPPRLRGGKGYGLDYAQQYRNMPYISVLKPEVYSK